MNATTRPKRLGTSDGPDGQPFKLGQIVTIHEIGDYQIVEFLRDTSRHLDSAAWADHGKTMYSPFVNHTPPTGGSTLYAFHTLDSALVCAIAFNRARQHQDSLTDAKRAAETFDITTGMDPETC